jgi:hypothetical protein
VHARLTNNPATINSPRESEIFVTAGYLMNKKCAPCPAKSSMSGFAAFLIKNDQ